MRNIDKRYKGVKGKLNRYLIREEDKSSER